MLVIFCYRLSLQIIEGIERSKTSKEIIHSLFEQDEGDQFQSTGEAVPGSATRPWHDLPVDIQAMIANIEASATSTPSNTDDFRVSTLPIISSIEDASASSKLCVDIIQNVEEPMGIPSISTPDLHLGKQPVLCLLYSSAFVAGLSMFNEQEFWSFSDSFGQHIVSPPQCHSDKTAKLLVDSLYFDKMDAEGRVHRGVNMVVVISGDASVSFQV